MFELDEYDVAWLFAIVQDALNNDQSLKVSVRENGLSFKRGEGMWTSTMGKSVN